MLIALFILSFLLLQHSGDPVDFMLKNQDAYILDSWTYEDGLPVNSINNLIQTKDGYLWFTTHDGLVRFDGTSFMVFNTANTPGLPGNRLLDLFEDSMQRIWITSENGFLIKLENGRFTSYPFATQELLPLTRSVISDRHENIWIGTDQGLYKYENGEIKSVYANHGNRYDSKTAILEHSDGTILAVSSNTVLQIKESGEQKLSEINSPAHETHFATAVVELAGGDVIYGSSAGIIKIYPGEIEKRYRNTVINDKPVRVIHQTEDEKLIMGYDGGIFIDDNEQYKHYPLENENPDILFKQIYSDSDGLIWITSSTGHLYQYDGESIRKGPFYDELLSLRLHGILQDHEGNYWGNTIFGGLIRLKKRDVFVFNNRDGLNHHNITSVTETPTGEIWVTTLDMGFNVIKDGQVLRYSGNDIPFSSVKTSGFDYDGNVYIGYFNYGYEIFRPDGSREHVMYPDHYVRNQVNSFYAEENGTLWIGTNAGLTKKKDGEITQITIEDGLPHNYVRYIVRDKMNNLWIGTNGGGVARYDGAEFEIYNTDNGLSSNLIRSVYPDPDYEDVIWIGTEDNGLNVIHGDEIYEFNSEHGIFDNVIHKIIDDNNRRLWMSTNRGIFFVYKDSLLESGSSAGRRVNSISFAQNEGMKNPEANGGTQSAGVRTRSGHLLFPTQDGVAILNPAKIHLNDKPPFVHITEIIADEVSYPVNEPIVLPPGVKNVSVSFTGVSFTNAANIRYRHKLSPLESEFGVPHNRRTVFYTFLAPGQYTFSAIASNNHGVWNTEGPQLLITVQPYYWQTAWFRLLSAGFVFGMFTLFFGLRIRNIKKREKVLEDMVRQRTEELYEEKETALEQKKVIEEQAVELVRANQTKNKFFSIIAHDLRGSFHGIHGFSKLMRDDFDTFDDYTIKHYLNVLHDSSTHVAELLENLLNWARIQSRTIEPELTDVDLKDITDRNLQLYSHIAEKKQIKLVDKLENPVVVRADENMVDLVVRNLVSNAVKYCKLNGSIVIGTEKDENGNVCLYVSDTGVGMSKAQIDNLANFDNTKSTRGTEDESGTGIGLSLCHDLMKLMGGSIYVESKPDKGSRFTLVFGNSRAK